VADAGKIANALNDLITVAASLSDQGVDITAEFSRGRQQEVMVKVSVSGSGIGPEALTKALDHSINSSVQTRTDTDEVQKRLNAVHEVVAMHGGRMFVSSAGGQGSTLLFTLPAVSIGGEDKSNEQAVNISRR